MSNLDELRKTTSHYLTQSLARFFAKTPITPNAITWLGFLLTIGAAVLIVTEDFIPAGLVVLFAGFLDMLDGSLARLSNQATRFGAVLDSTLDRLSEAAVLLGALVLFARQQLAAESFLAGFTLLGSLMVSYVRARIEGVGLECKVGLFTRAERVIVLTVGLLLSEISYYALVVTLIVIALLSFLTLGQRLFHAYKRTGGK